MEIYEDVVQTIAKNSYSYATIKKWAAEFNWGRDSTGEDLWSDHPKTSITDEQVDAIHHIILDNRHLTILQIAYSIGITSGLVFSVLTEIFEIVSCRL